MSNFQAPKYTPEQEAWLKDVPSLSWRMSERDRLNRVTQDFNRSFGTDRSNVALVLKQRSLFGLGSRTSAPARKRRKKFTKKPTKYTKEMDDFLRTLVDNKDLSWAKKTWAFGHQFDLNIKKRTLRWHWYKLQRRAKAKAKVAESKVSVPIAKSAASGAPDHYRVMVNGESVWSGSVKPQVIVQQSTMVSGF